MQAHKMLVNAYHGATRSETECQRGLSFNCASYELRGLFTDLTCVALQDYQHALSSQDLVCPCKILVAMPFLGFGEFGCQRRLRSSTNRDETRKDQGGDRRDQHPDEELSVT